MLCLFFFTACPKVDNGNGGSGLTFLVGSYGTTSIKAGLYTFDAGSSPAFFTLVSESYPRSLSLDYLDYNNGRIAFTTDIKPKDASCIAYVDVDDWANLKYAPIPTTSEKGMYYSVPGNIRPLVLNDGKIVYRVTYETDNIYDDYHVGQLAIYDPATDELEISGDPSGFVLAQPEKGGDTEGGSMGGPFTASPDSRYVYCTAYGYGTDWGVYHIDYSFIVKYEIGKPGIYKRIAQTDGRVNVVSGDGKYLIVSSGGLSKIDLATNQLKKFDDYDNTFNTNQVAKNSSQMVKMWRGSGCGLFDVDLDPAWKFVIIDGSKLTGSYRGLGHGIQYSPEEGKIYFTASTDYYTNWATPLRIFSSPVISSNIAPDSVSTMPVEYCTGVFLLLDK